MVCIFQAVRMLVYYVQEITLIGEKRKFFARDEAEVLWPHLNPGPRLIV